MKNNAGPVVTLVNGNLIHMARGLITAAGTGRASLRKHSPQVPPKQTQPLNFVNTTHLYRLVTQGASHGGSWSYRLGWKADRMLRFFTMPQIVLFGL